MLLSSQMPDLNRYQKPEQKIDALYQYVFTLQNQINHVLSNLDTENLGKELNTTLEQIQSAVSSAVQQSGQTQAAQAISPWPVGAVYMAADAAHDPEKLFGGKWEQVTSPKEGLYTWERKE